MFDETKITTLRQAYEAVLFIAIRVFEESVPDSLPSLALTVEEYGDALEELGVITPDLNVAYKNSFAGEHVTFLYMAGDELTGQLKLLLSNVVDPVEPDCEESDQYLALLYAVLFLRDKKFQDLVLESLREFEIEYGDIRCDVDALNFGNIDFDTLPIG